MKQILKLIAVTYIHSSWYLRNKYAFIGILIYPMAFYILLNVVGGFKMATHAVIGALVALMWTEGVGHMPQFLLYYKFIKLQDMFVASPIHPLVYWIGSALSVLVFSFFPTVVLLSLLLAHMHMTLVKFFYVTLVILVTWLMSSALGFTIAGYVRDPTRIGTIAPWASALLTTLPPVYYPLEMVPTSYHILALLVPTTHLSQLAKIALGVSNAIYGLPFHIIAIVLYTITFILLAGFRSRWREK